MRWPLRRKLFVVIAAGAALLTLVMSLLVDRTVVGEIHQTELQNLEHTRAAFESLQQYRRDQLLERCRLVSDLPYFKAAAAVFDPTRPLSEQRDAVATVDEVARRILSRVDVDLLVLTATDGSPLLVVGGAAENADTQVPGLTDLVRRALQQSNAEGVVALPKGLVHLTAVPLQIGGQEFGALALGTLLSSQLSNSLESMTGSAVALLGSGGMAAASTGVPPGAEPELMRAWTQRNRLDGDRSLSVRVDGNTFRTLIVPLTGPRGDVAGAFVVMRSEAPALAFRTGVRQGLVGIGGAAVIIALMLSFVFSRQLTTPLARLVAFTERLGAGDLNARVDLDSGDEMESLGHAFNRMAEGLSESRLSLETSHEALEERQHELERTNAELRRSQEETEAVNEALRETHAKLIQAGKMAAFGELGAGLAHELRQPLSSIRGFAQLVRMRLPESESALRKYPDLIMDSVDHMTSIVQGLKDFARKASQNFEAVSVNAAIERTALLMSSQLRNQGIDLTLDLDPSCPPLNGEVNQLQQVFTNLIANAKDAMEGPGTVRIQTCVVDEGSCILATVTDTGPGIPQDILPKIFGSFFTTKPEGKGTGLGLSITQGIVKDHGGRIEVSSTPGEGTTFRIYLPTVQATDRSDEASEAA